MALVPYVENSLPALSKLHNSSAQFRFADHDLRLAQDWKKLGVAAVVWDAVGVFSDYVTARHSALVLELNAYHICFPGSCHVYVSGAGEGGVKGEGGNRTGSWHWTGGHCSSPAG